MPENFVGRDLSSADFADANLTGASLGQTGLTFAYLSGANLNHAQLDLAPGIIWELARHRRPQTNSRPR